MTVITDKFALNVSSGTPTCCGINFKFNFHYFRKYEIKRSTLCQKNILNVLWISLFSIICNKKEKICTRWRGKP